MRKPFKPFMTPMEDWDKRLKILEKERQRQEPEAQKAPARMLRARGVARATSPDDAYHRDGNGHERFTLWLGTPAR